MIRLSVSSILFLLATVNCDVVLEERGYLQLPNRENNLVFDSGTAKESAIDTTRRILYVIGEQTAMMHVIDLSNVDTLNTILTYNFNLATEGKPLDVEYCSSALGSYVAVSFESTQHPQAEGHIILYRPVTVGQPSLAPINPADPSITVGPHPDNIKFTSDCSKLVVSNEGIPGTVENNFVDPPGSVDVVVITSPTSSTVERASFSFVDDTDKTLELLNAGVRWMVRANFDTNEINPFSNNIEPEYIAISPNDAYAYVTLQENNAIAQISLESYTVANIYPLGSKEWKYSTLDASDMDSGKYLKKHDISSFYQPDKIAFFEWKEKLYLITADEGKQFNIPVYFYTDSMLARNLHANGDFLVDPALAAELANDTELGRYFVSQFHDGRVSGKIRTVYGFGGRGFSVLNPSTMTREWESGDEIEKFNRLFYPDVFNGDCTDENLTPFQEKDKLSTSTGPSLNAIIDGEFNGRKLIVVASGTNGLIYLYELSSTVANAELMFQSVHRRGGTIDTWGRLYSSGNIGDAGIEDMSWIPIEHSPVAGSPVLVVVSSTSGSVSAYTLTERQFPHGQNGNGAICQQP
ncbi:hypothetical protein LOTGIDRAFT_159825 [Lottia gigantea]|uniref:Choice-of-anchor I domain-containing protein n=1 Tax=Lottia gigantea TaxID=225164 RepID=V4ARU6_LOTGI|nr:hypothetical protein LOTGIDRAFT_159825 [Lottia gigantea]ESO96416.1 hypothetical protein LOTGIDRAFT_159825 [Lottia gigantea]